LLVTVIIPTYNRAHLIRDAIDSVLNQTYIEFELLIIDDHSTDDTKEVVEAYKDKRIKYLINSRTKGAQGARNTGLYAAKGEWVAMLDSDDVWLPKKLEMQIDFIKKSDESVLGVGCGFAFFNFKKEKISLKRISDKKSVRKNDLLYKNYVGGFSVFIFKREAGINIGGMDERFLAKQDIDFYIRLSTIGKIKMIKSILVYNRETNNDRISKDFKAIIQSLKLFKKKYYISIERNYRLKVHHNSNLFFLYVLDKDLRLFSLIYWPIVGLVQDPIYVVQQFNIVLRFYLKKAFKTD